MSVVSPPEVSVVIPTYNRSALLQRAVSSVLRQTGVSLELIVVDDGSTIDTRACLEPFKDQLILHCQTHQGVSVARNAGIALASAPWIALLDSDDEWEPNKLQQQMQALRASPDHCICHTNERWVRDGVFVNPMKKHIKKGGWIFNDCLPLCLVSPSSVVIHRSVFDRVGLFDPSLLACEDYDLWLRITLHYPLLYLEQPLTIKYGGHDDQLSKAHWGMDRFRVKSLMSIIDNETLTREQREAVVNVLQKKLTILHAGAKKRQQTTDTSYYESCLHTYC